jgi:hypothetical protein
MTRISCTLFAGIAILLLLIAPAAATPVLTGDSFTPSPPLVAGGQQQVVATYMIASGTTFPENHELQMTTALSGARWTIQVVVDGHNAATQTASGTAVFVNGEILSYSANRDVSFTVTIDGMVDGNASGAVTVLKVEEIDNTGSIVPGSTSTISQPVAGESPAPSVTTVPALTRPPVTTTPVKNAPGISPVLCSLALVPAGMAALRRRQS